VEKINEGFMGIKFCEECHSQLDGNGRHYHVTDCVNKKLDRLEILEKALQKIIELPSVRQDECCCIATAAMDSDS